MIANIIFYTMMTIRLVAPLIFATLLIIFLVKGIKYFSKKDKEQD